MLSRFSGLNSHKVAHDTVLSDHFRAGIGYKAFILMPSYPYLLIGEIASLVENYVKIFVKKTYNPQLEDQTWLVHVHSIQVYYSEPLHQNL